MSTKNPAIYPYLNFDGRAEEAIEFYRKALNATPLMVMRFKDAPPGTSPAQHDQAVDNKIMHARLAVGNTSLMLSDGRCTNAAAKFTGISLSLNVATSAEAEKYFHGLSEGGEVQMPMTKTFFSPAFGMVTDKFGVMWMVHVETAH